MPRQHSSVAVRVCSVVPTWLLACVGMLAAGHTFAVSPTPVRSTIDVYPLEIELNTADDFQSVIAVQRRPDGVTVDITDEVRWRLADPSIAWMELSADGPKADGQNDGVLPPPIIRPRTDGETELVASWEDQTLTVPVRVINADVVPPVSFRKHVMPVLTRAGCNTGSCHGAARGKDGFGLSLFGFDPDGDYHRITREMGARRINLAMPSESLLLNKATGSVRHTGGKLFEPTSHLYDTLHRWLDAGAPADDADAPPAGVVALDVYPPQAVIEGAGVKQSLIAVATYDDGTTRDVTRLSAFATNNDAVATIDDSGSVTAGDRGEAFVMARFETQTTGIQVLTLPQTLEFTPIEMSMGLAGDAKTPSRIIDDLVNEKLNQLRIRPSERCDDGDFIRRVTIDITGLLPTIEEVNRFVADSAPDKRDRVVDDLLARDEFAEIWAMKFAQLLMIKSNNIVSGKAAYLFSTWLSDKLIDGEPIDEIVKEILTASGGTLENPPTNYYEFQRNPNAASEHVAQVFMGIRMQCAQCHNHPFDRWTMDDYYGFAAFFGQVGRKQAEDYRERIVFDRGGEVRHPVTNQRVAPRFLGAERPDFSSAPHRGKPRREVVADWLTSPENPYFARSVANRIWAHFMGSGVIDPVDDVRVSNPPSNPALLDELARRLVEYEFDFRRLVRDICTSDAYQRSSRANESNAHDQRNYARAAVRRIPAEHLLDCISQVTGSPDKFRGLPRGARAVQIADGRTSNYFLDAFGRSQRTSGCACEASTGPSLSQALHLINGSTIHGKISRGKRVRQWWDESEGEELRISKVIDKIYLASLSRLPTASEGRDLMAVVDSSPDPVQGLEDVFWSVLNGREFLFNH